MSATLSYRISAGLFLLFATLHTIGFLSLRPPTPESAAVWDGMNHVRFAVGSSSYSYGEFYLGFGLSATVTLLFQSFLAWELGRLARTFPKGVAGIGWALCATQVAGLIITGLLISVKPAAFSAVLAALLGW